LGIWLEGERRELRGQGRGRVKRKRSEVALTMALPGVNDFGLEFPVSSGGVGLPAGDNRGDERKEKRGGVVMCYDYLGCDDLEGGFHKLERHTTKPEEERVRRRERESGLWRN